MNRPQRLQLEQLNRLRNKCSHNWLLNIKIRKGIKPSLPKRPLLDFRGGDLHTVSIMEKFIDQYTVIYLHLYMRIY